MAILVRCPSCAAAVRAHDSLHGTVAQCPKCAERLPIPSRAGTSTDSMLGRKFAHYQIESVLRDGPIQSVYRAHNLRLDMPAVLKMLSERVAKATPEAAEQFVSDARAAASLDHRNILPIRFVGACDGHYFIEMPFAEGGTVRQLLERKGRLPVAEAARIIHAAAQGLSAAHAKHIVHHNVRPQNLMLTEDGVVKLSDFGLSAFPQTQKGAARARWSPASLRYTPPEALDGPADDPRSDIYALGITFFELLTGHPPFDAPSLQELRRMLAEEAMPSPSAYVLDIPDSIRHIVMKMAARKRDHRYATLTDVLRDLDRAHIPAPEVPTSAPLAADSRPHLDAAAATVPQAREALLRDLAEAAEDHAPVSVADSDLIVSSLVLEDQDRPALISADPRKMKRRSARMLRRAERKRLLRRLTSVGSVAVLLAMLCGIGYGARWGLAALKASAHARRVAFEKEQSVQSAKHSEALGREAELRGDWSAAAENYKDSLLLSEEPAVRARLNLVTAALEGIALEEKQDWARAETILAGILPDVLAPLPIQRHLRRVKSGMEYATVYAQGKAAYDQGDWLRAIEDLRRATGLAQALRLTTDAAEFVAAAQTRLSGETARRVAMDIVFDACKARGNPYAALAACDYYLASAKHQTYADVLRSRKEEGRLALASNPDCGRKQRLPKDANLTTLTLKKGGSLLGKVVAQRGDSIEFETVENGRTTRRLFHANDIASQQVIAPAEINAHHAEELCGEMVAAWKAAHPFDVLQMLGELKVKFADAPIVADAAAQKSRFGQTLDELLAYAVPACESMCVTCDGTGHLTCPQCAGKGERTVRCKTCENPSRLPICPKCQGSRLRFTAPCQVCGGSGMIHCKRCNSRGCAVCQMRGKWPCTACGGSGKTFSQKPCPTCGGDGRVGDQVCPKCFGRGRARGLYCNGTGRQTCPDCNGKREVVVPCDVCKKSGQTVCPACKGGGKRSCPG